MSFVKHPKIDSNNTIKNLNPFLLLIIYILFFDI